MTGQVAQTLRDALDGAMDEIADDLEIFEMDEEEEEGEQELDFEEEIEIPKKKVRRSRAKTKVPMVMGVPKSKLADPTVAASVWEKMDHANKDEGLAYNIKVVLTEGAVVEHKRFGRGFVLSIPVVNQAEVLFNDGVRKLVHAR